MWYFVKYNLNERPSVAFPLVRDVYNNVELFNTVERVACKAIWMGLTKLSLCHKHRVVKFGHMLPQVL